MHFTSCGKQSLQFQLYFFFIGWSVLHKRYNFAYNTKVEVSNFSDKYQRNLPISAKGDFFLLPKSATSPLSKNEYPAEQK